MLGARNTSGAVYMNRQSSRTNTTMIGSPSIRAMAARGAGEPSAASLPSALLLQIDQVLGELGDGHVLRRDLGHDLAAVEDDQPVGDLVDMGEIVLDIDAGAA